MPAGKLDRFDLEGQQVGSDIVRDAKFLDAVASILGKVPSDFKVNVKGWDSDAHLPNFLR